MSIPGRAGFACAAVCNDRSTPDLPAGPPVSVVEAEAVEVQLEAPAGLWRDAFHRLIRNPGAIVGFVFVFVFVIAAVFAPLIATHDPVEQNLLLIANGCCPGPSAEHWFGVDLLGRDLFSRIVYGARVSLLIGVVAVSFGLTIGLFFGAIAGYVGGVVDSTIMRFMDVMLAVGLANVPIFARLVRSSILAQRDADFVVAAKAVGVKQHSILFSHILPNAISPVIVTATLAMATAIIDVAGLGFLGIGLQDPDETPEWGSMLTEVNEYLQTAPFLALIPGTAIVISVLGFNLIGDGLREALDPKLRGR